MTLRLHERKFEKYRIEGGPHGYNLKVFRDGKLVPGVTSFDLTANTSDIVKLTITQIIELEPSELIGDITEETK